MKVAIVTESGIVSGAMMKIVNHRNWLLKDADNLVNIAEDNELDAAPFRQYRQALRDIPQKYTNPEDVVWPQKPSLPQASA